METTPYLYESGCDIFRDNKPGDHNETKWGSMLKRKGQ
jgi:hypothetical protein